jgi:hypothetical protein
MFRAVLSRLRDGRVEHLGRLQLTLRPGTSEKTKRGAVQISSICIQITYFCIYVLDFTAGIE